jgi:hypothetical protein
MLQPHFHLLVVINDYLVLNLEEDTGDNRVNNMDNILIQTDLESKYILHNAKDTIMYSNINFTPFNI